MNELNREPPAERTPGSNCADVVLRLFEYVDNEAEAADSTLIRAHLDQCGSCLQEYERDMILKALIRRACGCEAAPEKLRAQILTQITQVSVQFRGSTD